MSSEAPAATSTSDLRRSARSSDAATAESSMGSEDEQRSIRILEPDFVFPHNAAETKRNLVLQVRGTPKVRLWMVQSLPPKPEDAVKSDMTLLSVGESHVAFLPFHSAAGTNGCVPVRLYYNLHVSKHRGATTATDFTPIDFIECQLKFGQPPSAARRLDAPQSTVGKEQEILCQTLLTGVNHLTTKYKREDIEMAAGILLEVTTIAQSKTLELKKFAEKVTEEIRSEVTAAVKKFEEKVEESTERRAKELQELLRASVLHEIDHSSLMKPSD